MIRTSLSLLCKSSCSYVTRCICMTNAERSVTKQGQPQPRCHSKARLPSTHLLTGPLLSMLLRNSSDKRMTEEKQLSYGWLRFRPTWLQFLNTPKWFLFFLSQYFFTQSIVLNGIYPGSISTIERRFGYSRLVCELIRITQSCRRLRFVYLSAIFMFIKWLYVTKQWIKVFFRTKKRS